MGRQFPFLTGQIVGSLTVLLIRLNKISVVDYIHSVSLVTIHMTTHFIKPMHHPLDIKVKELSVDALMK